MSTVQDVVNGNNVANELRSIVDRIRARNKKSVWACLGNEAKGCFFSVTECFINPISRDGDILYDFVLNGRDCEGNFITWSGQSGDIKTKKRDVGILLAVKKHQPLIIYI